jgi:3-phosphoshikimate 1-carboxyvinyltransferase
VEREGSGIRARFSPGLHGTEVGGPEVPGLIDEIPVLAVAAAAASGPTTFTGAAELVVKESDRIATTVRLLAALGAGAEALADGLVVTGRDGGPLRGGLVDSSGDHRIAMAGAVAGLAAAGVTRIEGWESVATSYPRFEEDLRSCVS